MRMARWATVFLLAAIPVRALGNEPDAR